jgi:GT2 family glycosyltransferase
MSTPFGVVVIGRNEGERLARCLASLRGHPAALVYVDSGSSDGSPERARVSGADVVEVEPSAPFTAARGRNAGLERLAARHPGIELVQFVDGDCEVAPGWLEAAATYLAAHPAVAVVCGRRRERHPAASPWNQLADLEWDTPVGEAQECGGDAMMRVAALREAGGYRAAMIAGEEPELCLRLRRAGHRIVRLDRDMTFHDAALTRMGQWWRRAARAGHAYAECAWLHGGGPERFRVRELASALAWGAALPAAALLGAPFTKGASLLLLAGYAILWRRVYGHRLRAGNSPELARLYAAATVVGKLAQAQGALAFAWNRILRRRASALIEYKGAGTAGPV